MDCGLAKLEKAMESPAGAMYRRVADIKFALRERFNIGLEDLTIEEFHGFRVITIEQERYEARKARERK